MGAREKSVESITYNFSGEEKQVLNLNAWFYDLYDLIKIVIIHS